MHRNGIRLRHNSRHIILDLGPKDWMQRVDRRDRPLPIKEQKILQGLFTGTQDINNILGQVATDTRSDGAQLRAQVLEECAQKGGVEGCDVEFEFVVTVAGHLGEELEVLAGGEGWEGMVVFEVLVELLEFPERAEAGE